MHAETWSFELVVERGKLREMCQVLQLPTPDAAQDGGPTLAPLTFPVVLNHWGFSGSQILEQLGVDVRRVLHGEEDYEYPSGPLREGEQLVGTMQLASKTNKTGRRGGSMTVLTFTTDLVDRATGDLRARVHRTLMVRDEVQG